MRIFTFLIVNVLFYSSCFQNRTGSENVYVEPKDSIEKLISQNEKAQVENKQIIYEKNGSFDSFFIRFDWNANFQKKRIKFPLEIHSKYDSAIIKAMDWKHINFYRNKSFYPYLMPFDRNVMKDNNAEFESINLTRIKKGSNEIANYYFENIDSTWFLVKIKKENLEDLTSANRFFKFVEKFSSDSIYQIERIDFPFDDNRLNYDDYSYVSEGVKKEDWNYVNILEHVSEFIVFTYNSEHPNSDWQNLVLYFSGIECGISIEYFSNLKMVIGI